MVNISTHIMNIERFIIMTGNECQLNTAAQWYINRFEQTSEEAEVM